MTSRQLQFYITVESPCSYYDDRMSRNLVPDPNLTLTMPIYNQLILHGFRRSGSHCYRPHCDSCQRCIACRIPVAEFRPSRAQRRCAKRNQGITATTVPARFDEEYFDLYTRYLQSRHAGSSMANPSETDFREFLYCDWSDTHFIEFRRGNKLVAVAVTDFVRDGLSAVYSFYEPTLSAHSPGTFCILQQIEIARRLNLPYVYLGYWIEQHPKMQYKVRYRPLQIYRDDHWQRHE